MLSIPDMAVLGAVALVLFGPDRLPVVARKAGKVMRDVQNTSQSFIREMERAADHHETPPVDDPYALHPDPVPVVVQEPPEPAHDPADLEGADSHAHAHEAHGKPAGTEPQPF